MGLLSRVNSILASSNSKQNKSEGLLKKAERIVENDDARKEKDAIEIDKAIENTDAIEADEIAELDEISQTDEISATDEISKADKVAGQDTVTEAEEISETCETNDSEEIDDTPTSQMFESDQWNNNNVDEEKIPTVEDLLSNDNEENSDTDIEIPALNIDEDNIDEEIDDRATTQMFKNSQWDNSVNNDDDNADIEELEEVEANEENKNASDLKTVSNVNFLQAFIDFESFCKKMEFEKAGIFSCQPNKNNECELLLSYNISSREINQSESKKEFWDKLISNYAWNILEDEELDFIKPIFSDDINEDLYNVTIKKFNFSPVTFIFFAINCTFENYKPIDIEDELYKLKKPLVSFIELSNDKKDNIDKSEIKKHILENFDLGAAVIFSVDFFNVKYNDSVIETNRKFFGNILQNHICSIFPLPDVVFHAEDSIKVIHFCKYGTDSESLKQSFLTDLSSFLGTNCLSSLTISDFRKTDVMDEVLYHVLG